VVVGLVLETAERLVVTEEGVLLLALDVGGQLLEVGLLLLVVIYNMISD